MKTFRKSISLILIAALLFTCLGTLSYAQEVSGSVLPTVYVSGYGSPLFTDYGTPQQKQIYPVDPEGDYVLDQTKKILPTFAKAVITNNYDQYCDELFAAVEPVFEPIKLDKTGVPKDNSSSSYINGKLNNKALADGSYDVFAYRFSYDWRLDPICIADSLASHIDAVLEATGHDKVNLVVRCFAGNILLAYLDKYGHEDKIATAIFYSTCVSGVLPCSKAFSGNIKIEPDALNRYCDFFLEDDGYIMDFVKATVALFEKTYAINLLTNTVNSLVDKLREDLLPRLIYSVYGNMPGFWSMIGAEEYESAKQFIFGNNTEEYAQLIEKLDNYHYNIQRKAFKIIEQNIERGINIVNISKYGVQLAPLVEGVNVQADGTVELSSASFGATSAPIDGKFDTRYVQNNRCCGQNHISPDRKVDASTCLLPDRTWFIKNIEHNNFPDSINEMFYVIMNYEGKMNVFDNEKYPQFMVYDKSIDTIVPMTEENMNTETWDRTTIETIVNFIKAYVQLFKQLLTQMKNTMIEMLPKYNVA